MNFTMNIQIGLETQYAEYKAKNTDPYGGRVVSYGEDWANLMEARLAKGEKIADMAKITAGEADTDGITGFMYSCAVSALAHFWVHGEELRQWHNLDVQYHHEGEAANESGGVLNPAIVSIEVP